MNPIKQPAWAGRQDALFDKPRKHACAVARWTKLARLPCSWPHYRYPPRRQVALAARIMDRFVRPYFRIFRACGCFASFSSRKNDTIFERTVSIVWGSLRVLICTLLLIGPTIMAHFLLGNVRATARRFELAACYEMVGWSLLLQSCVAIFSTFFFGRTLVAFLESGKAHEAKLASAGYQCPAKKRPSLLSLARFATSLAFAALSISNCVLQLLQLPRSGSGFAVVCALRCAETASTLAACFLIFQHEQILSGAMAVLKSYADAQLEVANGISSRSPLGPPRWQSCENVRRNLIEVRRLKKLLNTSFEWSVVVQCARTLFLVCSCTQQLVQLGGSPNALGWATTVICFPYICIGVINAATLSHGLVKTVRSCGNVGTLVWALTRRPLPSFIYTLHWPGNALEPLRVCFAR